MSNDPVLIAYGVKRRSTTKRVHWQRIGEAYPHDSGAGMTVVLGAMPLDAIEHYIASGEPFGKAGAYAIQSSIAGWIERIDGSYSSIMGLPLYETAHLLRQARLRF